MRLLEFAVAKAIQLKPTSAIFLNILCNNTACTTRTPTTPCGQRLTVSRKHVAEVLKLVELMNLLLSLFSMSKLLTDKQVQLGKCERGEIFFSYRNKDSC